MKKIITKTAKSLITISLLIFFASCNKDRSGVDISAEPDGQTTDTETPTTYAEINDWILENMQIYYLWNTDIPSVTDKTQYPSDYFESLLHRDDRFSWIQEDYIKLINSLSGVNTESGYDFNLLLMRDLHNVIGYITYIKPGTPAAAAGLKRGEYFHQINGTQITIDNYQSLIDKTAERHTLGISVIADGSITGVNSVTLDVIENYAENPVLLDTVYSIGGNKIAYLVYNFFARDNGDGSLEYEKQLNSIFGKFQSEQIDRLIIDLRYNSGGAVVTTEALASMISGQSTNSIFYTENYNDYLNTALRREYGPNYNKAYFIDKIEKYDGNNSVTESIPINAISGLSTVYFIVSGRSASASELLINGLKPYMEVILVGDTTYGKNVASITIYEDDPVRQQTNTWGMQPIIVKMANSAGYSDYGNGFAPDREAYEYDTDTIKQLGDTEELLLATTISIITGESMAGITAATKSTGIGRSTTRNIGSSIDRTPVRKNQFISLKNR
jgi:C-terminal processing protease CtpA/Prc